MRALRFLRAGFFLLTACSSPNEISGKVVDASQLAVPGAWVSFSSRIAETDDKGEYTLPVYPSYPRVVLTTQAPGFVTQYTIVRMDDDVSRYKADIIMSKPSIKSIVPGEPTLVYEDEHENHRYRFEPKVAIKLPSDAVPPGALQYVIYAPENVPGAAEALSPKGAAKLKAIGTFYVQAIGLKGNPSTLGLHNEIEITIPHFDPQDITPYQAWMLDQNARWSAPQPLQRGTFRARSFGYWAVGIVDR